MNFFTYVQWGFSMAVTICEVTSLRVVCEELMHPALSAAVGCSLQ